MVKQLFADVQDEKKLKGTARHWAATFFKKPDLTKLGESHPIRYMIMGEEICPSTGRVHWQAYIEFIKPIRMAGVKNLFSDKTIHLGIRYKSRENARDYCMKDNKHEEFGYWISGQGYRADIHDVAEALKNGAKLEEIIEDNPMIYCQYRNGIKDIAAHYQKKRVPKYRKLEIILISGPTRCGKTRMAMEEATFKTEGWKLRKDWWDGYDEDKCILIDEYSNSINCEKMLTILDGYPLKLEIKGSHTYAFFEKVYITTNLKIHEIHRNALPEHRNAFFARIAERGKIIDMWPKDDAMELE